MRLSPAPTGYRRQSGFTLIEVLIAVIIFSIGLLGIAGLQMAGLRYTQTSQARALAVNQAESLADRMRANIAGVDDGDYNIQDEMPDTLTTNCADENTTCNTDEISNYDLFMWNNANGAVLPGGSGVVCVDSTPDDGFSADWQCDNTGNVYAIKVTWNERGVGEDEADSSVQRLVMRFIPL